MEVTEAPSVHRATELVCQFYQQLIYKAFTPKQLSRICTLHLCCSLCRRHLRYIAFTSVPSVTPCAYDIRLLVYHSIFRKTYKETYTQKREAQIELIVNKKTCPITPRVVTGARKRKLNYQVLLLISHQGHISKNMKKIINSESFKTEFVFKSVLLTQNFLIQ